MKEKREWEKRGDKSARERRKENDAAWKKAPT